MDGLRQNCVESFAEGKRMLQYTWFALTHYFFPI